MVIGISSSMAASLFDNNLLASVKLGDDFLIDGIKAIDAHSHPYHLHLPPLSPHGKIKHLRTTATVGRMREAGFVASVFAAVGDRLKSNDSSASSLEDTFEQLERIKKLEDKRKIRIIRSASDLKFAGTEEELFGGIMSIEGGDALEGEISKLHEFYEYGVRLITIGSFPFSQF